MRTAFPVLCLLALAAAPAPLLAAPRSIAVVLLAPDGSRAPALDATDASLSLNRSSDNPVPDLVAQVSVSLDVTAMTSKPLLEWLKQNGTGAIITVEGRNTAPVTYELRDITSRSLSVNHSSSSSDGQLSLMLGAGALSVNGMSVR